MLLLVYTLLLRGIFLWHPAWIPVEGGVLAPYINNWINNYQVSFLALQLVDILLLYLQALLLNYILTSNNIVDRYTYVPALMYITVASLFGEWIATNVETIAQLFLLLSMLGLFTLTGKELSRENIFYTSLCLSIGSFFYFPLSFFLLIIVAGLLIRSYSLLDFMLLVTGFVLPYYFLGIGMYYTGNYGHYLHSLQQLVSFQPVFAMDFSYVKLGVLIYVALLIFYGYFLLAGDREFKIVKQRTLVFLVMGFFVVVVLASPFITGSKLQYLQLITMPAAIFLSKIFNRERLGIIRNLLFYLLVGTAIFFSLYYQHIV